MAASFLPLASHKSLVNSAPPLHILVVENDMENEKDKDKDNVVDKKVDKLILAQKVPGKAWRE